MYAHRVQTGLSHRALGYITDLHSIDLDALVRQTLPHTNFILSLQKNCSSWLHARNSPGDN